MAYNKKHILLDSDFCIKSVKIQVENKKFIDMMFSFRDIVFYCHEKTLFEISDHDDVAKDWLQKAIAKGDVILYTDKNILDELDKVYGKSKYVAYCSFLKKACDIYSASDYTTNFNDLIKLGSFPKEEDFLSALSKCENSIGKHKSLGEKKSAVLLQMLQLLYHDHVYIFCSDDTNARRGLVTLGNVNCMSILSAFVFFKDIGYSKNELEPFFAKYEQLCNITHQTQFKIWDKPHHTCNRVPCRQVFDNIYNDSYGVMVSGELIEK